MFTYINKRFATLFRLWWGQRNPTSTTYKLTLAVVQVDLKFDSSSWYVKAPLKAVSDDDGRVFWSWVVCVNCCLFVSLNTLVFFRVRVPVLEFLLSFIWTCQRKERSKTWMTIVLNRMWRTAWKRFDRNDLPLSIRNKSSKIVFKKALKKYYLAQYWLVCVCVCVRACLCFNE